MRQLTGAQSQRDVIAWLATPAAHDEEPTDVNQIDTAAAVVFLAGTRAYKLKRAGLHEELDYASIEQRHAACQEELRLNRRTAPMLYQRVRAVSRASDGSLALDGAGDTIDWVVEMRRFDTDLQFDQLADRGLLDADLMRGLADAVVRLHEVAEWRFNHGGRDGMTRVITRNYARLRQHPLRIVNRVTTEQVIKGAFDLMHRYADHLESRRLSGFVRHCHGDLRLRNICLIDGSPMLFDSVELGPTVACIDVMHDLSLLLADLLDRGLGHHANILLNRYIEHTHDYASLTPLPLFLASRAMDLASAGTSVAPPDPASVAEPPGEDVLACLELAQQLLSPPAAQLVAIGGRSGPRRTTLAARLAPTVGPAPGALVFHDDVERRRLMGVRADAHLGDNAYSAGVTRQVYRTLAKRAGDVLRAGHAVLIDAAFADPVERAMVVDSARNHGVPFRGLWLDAPKPTARVRLGKHALDDFPAPRGRARHEPDTPPASWARVDATGHSDNNVWKAALETLAIAQP